MRVIEETCNKTVSIERYLRELHNMPTIEVSFRCCKSVIELISTEDETWEDWRVLDVVTVFRGIEIQKTCEE